MDVAVTFAIRQDCAAPIQDTPRWAVAKAFHAEAGVARAVAFSAGTRNSLVVLPLALAVPGGVPGGQIQSKVRAYDHAGRGAGFNRRDVEVEQSWCDDLAKVDKLLAERGIHAEVLREDGPGTGAQLPLPARHDRNIDAPSRPTQLERKS